uniref:Uncharacterized protein n=1 Tax=Siphoviridae sp. ct6d71 TaxID=2826298 RepID=A0A8S5R3D8_9CAUD|nr:MAG TPA: hypothetical protein [Siphoviridae sp. ct6d71]
MLGNSMENLTALLPLHSQNGLKILLLIDSKVGTTGFTRHSLLKFLCQQEIQQTGIHTNVIT